MDYSTLCLVKDVKKPGVGLIRYSSEKLTRPAGTITISPSLANLSESTKQQNPLARIEQRAFHRLEP